MLDAPPKPLYKDVVIGSASSVHAVADAPAQHPPGIPVNDGHEVGKASLQPHIAPAIYGINSERMSSALCKMRSTRTTATPGLKKIT